MELKSSNRKFPHFHTEKDLKWNGPFSFIQAADCQYGMTNSYLKKNTDNNFEEEVRLATKSIEAINKMNPKPRFMIMCGDLIDAFPNNPYQASQREAFKKTFSDLDKDIPLICVCGNHDIGNQPTSESIDSYTQYFGDDYFSFTYGGVKMIILNSQYFEDPSLVPQESQDHLEWLELELEDAKNGDYKHVLIFQHIPWFLKAPNEDNQYFNIEPELRQKWLHKFEQAGVRIIFCGHYHRNAGGKYKEMELVVTSALGAQLGLDLSGLRVVNVQESTIKHQYYGIDDIPLSPL